MEQVQTMTFDTIKSESKFLPWIVCFSAALFFFYEFIQLNMFNAISAQLMQTFSLNAEQYLLSITDPIVERKYLAGPNGEFKVGHAILCVSLGEPYLGYAYKLIAGVFSKP